MSKKQQTLLQSWSSNKPGAQKPTVTQNVSLLDSDEDDELMRQALEDSLRDYQLKQNLTSPALSSSSGYSTEAPSGVLAENLPGFDSEAGKTWIYPTNKPVRKYQRDIVETCIFQNTLVTLPTGLGKTFIAAVVMYNFFRWYPRGKIIFMAPTKPLVAQQIQACYEIMGIPLESTCEMTGAMNPNERQRHWQEKRVFFLTPQVLTNDISRATCPTNQVKCLVLDEAHKAIGNYPYVQVVQELTKHGAVFRILALSATPGSDLKAIQQVISNLLISKIELRNEESPDIVPYTHSRNIEKVIVPLGPDITQVRDQFLIILSSFARRLMNMNLLFTKDIGSLTKGMVLLSRERFRQNPPGNFQRSQTGMAEGDFAMCISLTHALELLLQHGIRGFYNFLAGKTDVVMSDGDTTVPNRTRTELFKVNGFSQMMETLKSKFGADSNAASAPVSHPKLTKLRGIVLEHFQRAETEKRPTRVMIFSQFRDSVYEIVSLFDDYAPLIKAMSFVGHGKGANTGGTKTKGFTQADQIRVIKQFTEGSYNTLVSTCVGEEGLDIGDVDMIICYDMHKSPVRLVQRCGRTGRKRDGRIIMLMTEGKEEHVFNQSMYQKKNLHKNMISSDKLKDFLVTNGPQMIPRGLRPQCHEMPMQVVTSFLVPQAPRSSKAGSSTSAARKTKTTKCYYLSDTEMDYWTRNLDTNERIPTLPKSGRDIDVGSLQLDKFLPWQSTLQPYFKTNHSSLTSNFVDILGLIQSQQGDDWYEDEPMPSPIGTESERAAPYETGDRNEPSAPVDLGFPEEDTNYGLYCPSFLNLFSAMSGKRNCLTDIPSPPPFTFSLSQECAANFSLGDHDMINSDIDVSMIPATPPNVRSTAVVQQENESEWLIEVSPVLSQRFRRPSFKRKLDTSAYSTTSPKGAPTTASTTRKRIKLEGAAEASIEKADTPTLHELPTSVVANQDLERSGQMLTSKMSNEETILSVSQIIDYVSTTSSSSTPLKTEIKQEVIQPNFNLEVDFLSDESPPRPKYDRSREDQFKSLLHSTPPKIVRPAPPIPESPVFDFTEREPSSTPSPVHTKNSVPRADFSLNFPDLSTERIGFVPSDITPSKTEQLDDVVTGAVVAKAEFSLGFPDFSEDADDVINDEKKSSTIQPSKDSKSPWDDGFVLDWADIEEMDALESAAIESPEEKVKRNVPVLPPPVSDSSRICREIEDIFGASLSASPVKEVKPSVPKPVVFNVDSEDDSILSITPPQKELFRGCTTTPACPAQFSDEESPMVGCKRLNPRRNPLMTQSTPVAPKRAEKRSKASRKKSTRECDFIDYEADLSSVDGVDCSEDEVEDASNADRYEGSFVDDQPSLQVNETMHAIYLKSVKSPAAQKGFVFRQPARQMNHSEIFSQAVVDQDSEYMMDSFCVDSDEVEESSPLLDEDDEVTTLIPSVPSPAGMRRTRRQAGKAIPTKTSRKRIIRQPDSSDSDVAASPIKMPAVSQEQEPSPSTSVLEVSISNSSSFALTREERLEKQRQKQEEFRRSRTTMNNNNNNISSVPATDRFVPPAPPSPSSRVLISSRQVATAGQIISTLQVKHRCLTHVCSFNIADFVVSPQLGVLRKLHSDLSNGSNRCRLQDQIRRLVSSYDKPYLIVEADRSTPRDGRFKGDPSPGLDPSSIIFKPNSPYLLQTLSSLAQTELSILHSESQEHSARLLNDLGRQESLRGLTLPETGKLSPKQEEIVRFLQRIPEINPAVALLMATAYRSLREILNSSAELINQRCKISLEKARCIVHSFRIPHTSR